MEYTKPNWISDKNNGEGKEWYAVYTKHQHEKTVARILMFKGFETLLPLYLSRRTWKTGRQLLHLPLFPGYVFLRGQLERRIDVMTTPGVHALVCQGGRPCGIPATEMDGIRQALNSGLQMEPHPGLKCGQRVRIRNGPMEGVEGVLMMKKNRYRLVISVEMLGKAASVEIPTSAVERTAAEERAVSAP